MMARFQVDERIRMGSEQESAVPSSFNGEPAAFLGERNSFYMGLCCKDPVSSE